MDPIDAATAFLGSYDKDRGSMQNSTVQSETHTITGTATSDSADGLVMVDLEGYTISEDDQQSLELPTTVDVHEGDTVQVTLVGGVAKSPIVTGVVGGGDRLSGNVTEALDAAQAAELIVRALNYYFFHDDAGAHVTTEPNNPNVGPNALLDALALYFRVGATPVAHFGANGSQIGKDDEAHLVIDYNSMEIRDENDRTFLFVGDLRDAEGKYELSETFTGDGTSTEYYPRYHVSDFILVTVGGVATTSYTYWQPDWDWAVDFTTAPPDGAEIVINYKTTDLIPVQTFGGRGGTIGDYSTAEGYDTIASGFSSHAEGGGRRGQMGGTVEASGMSAHAEGFDATASGDYSHAEGRSSASGTNSHAEGSGTASAPTSHAEGAGLATGNVSHAEGSGTASGVRSHAEGLLTEASGDNQHVSGKYNVVSNSYAEIIGNGTAAYARSNARTLDWNGNEELQGTIYLGGCTANGETPYSGVRHNTSTSFDEYYNGSTWKPASPRFYQGAKIVNVGSTNITSCLLWSKTDFESTFHTTDASKCMLWVCNGNVQAGQLGPVQAEYWTASQIGWHARWTINATQNKQFNYMVAVPPAYSTI